MTDKFLKFANGSFGRRVVKSLGLPNPLPLVRYQAEQPTINGNILMGGTEGSQLLESIASALHAMDAPTLAHQDLPNWVQIANGHDSISGRWGGKESGDKVKALLFDATGLTHSSQTDALYEFFHDSIRSLLPCGRVLVLGRPPERCSDVKQATVQRSLEGLTRSLGKECKRGCTSQLVYVAEGAEANLESTLRFFLSPRSAYVSGQVVRVSSAVGELMMPEKWSQPFEGKKVLVTGASRGIGLAIAKTFARDGADLVLLDIPQLQAELSDVSESLGAEALVLDISAEDAPSKLVNAARAQGGWDVIVHNAGITRDKKIANMKPELWQQVVNINLTAQERVNDALLRDGALNKNGRLICVSSISGIAGNMGQTNYACSKAGVIGMVQGMAPVVAEKNITINAVAPGFIETKMTASIPLAIREAGRRMNSMSQGGLPVDVAETIAWFANPASSGLNGNVVRVCGQSLLGA